MGELGDPAALFERMAERIRRNSAGEFGGAVLLVPPRVGGVEGIAIEILLISGHPEMEHFWATAEAQVAAGRGEWLQRVQGQVPMYGSLNRRVK